MTSWSLSAENLSKKFAGRTIFKNVSFALKLGESLSVLGRNGSGKSTLIKILIGLLPSSTGITSFYHGAEKMDQTRLFSHIGVVAPYVNFYDHLTAYENIQLKTGMHRPLPDKILSLFDMFKISKYKSSPVSTFSTGMIQRLRFIQSLALSPSFLFLDEPTSSLDNNGKEIVLKSILSYRSKSVTILATNDPAEKDLFENHITISDSIFT